MDGCFRLDTRTPEQVSRRPNRKYGDASFDRLVCAAEQHGREGETKRLGGLEIDD